MSIILQALFCCVIGYILGSLSPAYLLAKKSGYDIREEGSGNAGATNAFILLGKNAFFLTAILDILKAEKSKSTDSFVHSFQSIDLLLIDDMHILLGKMATQRKICEIVFWM